MQNELAVFLVAKEILIGRKNRQIILLCSSTNQAQSGRLKRETQPQQ
jgi:hypothetical protein